MKIFAAINGLSFITLDTRWHFYRNFCFCSTTAWCL